MLIDNQASQLFTVIEINARDRPSLLYDVTTILAELGLSITSAHIQTFGERAVDVFYAKNKFGLKVENTGQLESIVARLTEVLESAEALPPDRKAAPAEPAAKYRSSRKTNSKRTRVVAAKAKTKTKGGKKRVAERERTVNAGGKKAKY